MSTSITKVIIMRKKRDSKKKRNTKEVGASSDEIDTSIEKGKEIFFESFASDKLAVNYKTELKIRLRNNLFPSLLFTNVCWYNYFFIVN